MKKFAFAWLLLCASVGSFAHTSVLGPVNSETSLAPDPIFNWHFRIWIHVTKTYGSGGIPCGPGTGLCSTTTDGGASGGNGMPAGTGDYVGIDDAGNFCLYVADATGDRALTGSTFMQTGAMLIDSRVAAALGISPFTIKPGNYLIEHKGNGVVVIFAQK